MMMAPRNKEFEKQAGRATPAGDIEIEASKQTDPATLRKVALAGFAGTLVEWFDFAIYGFMAVYIAQAFFPPGESVTQLLQTFAVFAVAFALRPLGGAFFGALGDRIGRQKVLVITVVLMTTATAAIGVLPTYAEIGVWAAVLLTLARCAQGLSAGGEFVSAVAYVIEHSPSNKRARWGSVMPLAVFTAFASAALLAFLLSVSLDEQTLNTWGWRIPFIIAAPLGMTAYWIRRKLHESPLFTEAKTATNGLEQKPVRNALRTQWKLMLLLGAYISLTATAFYIFTTYMTTFLREVVGLADAPTLLSNVIALLCAAALVPFAGRLSDRIGRRRTMMITALLMIATPIPGYILVQNDGFTSVLLGQLLIMVGTAIAQVVTVVLLVELFPTRVRVTAAGITYNVSYALFGGTAPFIATLLIDATGQPIAPAVYLTGIAALALIASLLIPETAGRKLGIDADHASLI